MRKLVSLLIALALVFSLVAGVVAIAPTPAKADLSGVSVVVDDNTAGAESQYDVTMTTGPAGALIEDDTITIKFPAGTTGLGTLTAAKVTVKGVAAKAISASPPEVTITVPAVSIASNETFTVILLTGTGIVNPQTADSYTLDAKTSRETAWEASSAYDIVAGDISKLDFPVFPSSVSYNTPSSVITVQTQDQYGNPKDVAADTTINLSSDSATDEFSENATPWVAVTSVVIPFASSNSADFYYKDTTAGDWTITAAEDPSVPWADAVDTLTVAGPVELWRAGSLHSSYTTITAAIAAAVDDDVIKVSVGTYNESIVVDKSLTIEALSSPIIDGGGLSDPSGPAVKITAANVTFQGFTIRNFTCTPAAGIGAIWVEGGDGARIDSNTIYNITTTTDQPAGIGIDVHASDVEVTDNEIYDVDSIGIRVRHDWNTAPTTSNEILIDNNEVYHTGNTGVLITGYAKGVTITNNEIYESLAPTPYNLFVHYGASDITIGGEGNYIHDAYANIVLAGCDNVTIKDNTIEDATPLPWDASVKGKNIYILSDYGPWYDVDALSTNVEIVCNDILNADGWGVRILNAGAADPSAMATTTTIKYNNIVGNTEYGVQNHIATDVDATYNWWDHETGAYHATTNPGGQGDAVSDNVDYSPWIYKPYGDVVPTEEPAYAQSVIVGGSWTTFSTPIALDSSADTWGELATLSNLTAGYIAYRWDGSSWQLLTPDYVINPGEGFFIKPVALWSLPILYSTVLAPPTTWPVAAGWDLIGLMSLGEPGDDGDLVTSIALNCLGADLAQLISPAGNEATWVWIPGLLDEEMITGEAYWAYLLAARTLVGFEPTPVEWVPLP